MKFYISGKIGKKNPSLETLAKFKKAEDMLKGRGHEVFNPTTSGLGAHAESMAKAADYDTSFYQEIVLLDLIQLSRCDAVLVLGDWHNSPGSKPELMLAMALQKPIYYEAPNGRLFPVKFDVRKVVDYSDHTKAITLGEFMEKFGWYKPETPLGISADFILGAPFEQGFDRQIEGIAYEAKLTEDCHSPSGSMIVLDSYICCSINFD
jgi:hypothetical protein